MFRTSTCPSSGVRVVYCCMWCLALYCWTPHAAVHNPHSWRWTYRCPKHVELFMIINHNCCIKLVPLVILSKFFSGEEWVSDRGKRTDQMWAPSITYCFILRLFIKFWVCIWQRIGWTCAKNRIDWGWILSWSGASSFHTAMFSDVRTYYLHRQHISFNKKRHLLSRFCAIPIPGSYEFYITNEMQLIQCSLLLSALYMFRAVFPPIIRIL